MNHFRIVPLLSIALATVFGASLPAVAQVDPNKLVDALETTFGKHDGYRRSGAKGICATGEFAGSTDSTSCANA